MQLQKRITPDRVVLIGAVVATLAYIQDLRYDFIQDDTSLILLNQIILSWRNWKSLFVTHIFAEEHAIFTTAVWVHYRPVYRLWQMLNEQLFGSVTPWWHLSSVLLHFVVILLVYQVGVKLLKEPWTAAMAALLFAVHPIHAESVAYISASTDLLVTLFTLISFLAYFHYREEGASPVYLAVSVFVAALAMLSKESAAMFPWMLVAYEALRETQPGTERSCKRFLWTLPFFAVVGAYALVRATLFGLDSGFKVGGSRLAAFLDIPLVLVAYLRNLFWPFRLSFYYPSEWGTQWTLFRAAAALLVIGAAWLLWTRYRRRSEVRLQLLWAGILFAPALLGMFVFLREDWVHDRHMYLVSVPICLIVAAVLTDPRWPNKAAVTTSCAVLAILLIDLAVQIPRFSDNVAIYASAAKVAPRSLPVHAYFGSALVDRGRIEEASREFKVTTELAPQYPPAHAWYAGTLVQLGHDEEALAEYDQALALKPQSAPLRAYVLARVAELELKRSNYHEAEVHLREAVQLSPETPNYHALFAEALSHEGQTEEARQELQLEADAGQRAARERHASKD